MICVVCGSEIPDGTKVCPVCESVLEEPKEVISPDKEKAEEISTAPVETAIDNQQSAESSANRRVVRKMPEKKGDNEQAAKITETPADKVRKDSQFQNSVKEVKESAAGMARGISGMVAAGAQSIKEIADSAKTNTSRNFEKKQSERQKWTDKVGSFYLAENEVVIRKYLCARLVSGLFSQNTSNGYLYVTNQRVIYEGTDNNSRITMETPINSIGGITTYDGVNRNWILLIIGIFLLTATVFSGCISYATTSVYSSFGYRRDPSAGAVLTFLVMTFVACFLIYKANHRAYMLEISSSAVAGTAVLIGEGPQSNFLSNKSLYTLNAEPTAETNKMMSEIGALIHDIQMLGDGAIEKWKE